MSPRIDRGHLECFYRVPSWRRSDVQLPVEFVAASPLDLAAGEDEVAALADELVASLGLAVTPRFLDGDLVATMAWERSFRLRWWGGSEERLRRRWHELRLELYAAIDEAGAWPRYTELFRRARELAETPAWSHASQGQWQVAGAPEQRAGRAFTRWCQQVWTRAARADLARGPLARPWRVQLELVRRGVAALGVSGSELLLARIRVGAGASSVPSSPPPPPPPSERATPASLRRVFVSAAFDDLAACRAVMEHLERAGLEVFHGPLPERVEPVEHRLGRDIASVGTLVAVVPQVHPWLGLSWWTRQELDHALACRKRVVIVSPDAGEELDYAEIDHVSCGNLADRGAVARALEAVVGELDREAGEARTCCASC